VTPTAAQIVLGLSALWMVGVGTMMLVWPRRSLALLARMGSSPTIHFGEMAIRFAVGLLILLTAHQTRAPTALAAIGGFLMASALVLALLPRRWHAAYSVGWSRRIPPMAVRVLGPISWAMGAALIWAAA